MITVHNNGRTTRVQPGDPVNGSTKSTRVIFEDPDDGSDVHVQVVPFQNDDYGNAYGVGVYFTDGDGDLIRGTVLRWDYGPEERPTVIPWQRPHCAEDRCGEPCRHKTSGVI